MGASGRSPVVVLLLCLGAAAQSCDSAQTTIGILLAAGGQTPAEVDVSGTSASGSVGSGGASGASGASGGGAADPDPCAEEPCQNDGECTPAESDVSCACRPGFDGALCETNVDDCADGACENGECVDGVASFACACDPGFVGERCELPRLVTLERMPPFATFPTAISSDGRVVVGNYSFGTSFQTVPFRWTEEEGVRALVGDQPFESGTALDVSADGSVVVGSVVITEGVTDAFRWTEETGLALLGAGDFAEARGVSGDGSTIIGRFRTQTLDLFRWTEATRLRDVGTMSGGSLLALGVSDDASIVVGFGNTAEQSGVAFRWTEAEGFQELFPDITPTSASAISADGATIVGHCQEQPGGDRRAFVWTAESGRRPIPVGHLSPTEARSVNHDGTVIVGMSTEGGWIYDGEGNALLLLDVLEELGADVEGWAFLDPSDISADGTIIVGYGEHAETGAYRSFIARLAAD